MEKKNANGKCPGCAAVEGQVSFGFNKSGTQRRRCKKCGLTYTVNPKTRAYAEATRKTAIRTYYMGVSARGVGKIHNMGKENVLRWIKAAKKNDARTGKQHALPRP